MDAAALIAVDWGTSAARASLVASDGRVLATRQAPLGIQAIRDGRFADAFATLLGDWRTLGLRSIASGMIGSRQGWIEAPYVECPATIGDLAGRLVATPGGELVVVPGLLAREADGVPDVMRGEETQLVGAVGDDEEVLAVLPGTHSKWVHVAGQRLLGFATFMTGELYAVLLAHSILGRLAQPEAAAGTPGAAFGRGVARGLAGGALSHLTFGARTLALTGGLEGRDVADWLSGLLVGYEIRHAREWARARGVAHARVRVIGAPALVARYHAALADAGIAAEAGPPDAAERGLVRIARHAGWNL